MFEEDYFHKIVLMVISVTKRANCSGSLGTQETKVSLFLIILGILAQMWKAKNSQRPCMGLGILKKDQSKFLLDTYHYGDSVCLEEGTLKSS